MRVLQGHPPWAVTRIRHKPVASNPPWACLRIRHKRLRPVPPCWLQQLGRPVWWIRHTTLLGHPGLLIQDYVAGIPIWYNPNSRYDLPTTTFTVSFKLYMTKSSFITTFFNIIYNFCMHQASWCFNFQGLDFHCTASGDYSVLFFHDLERSMFIWDLCVQSYDETE
jgi:hypothetical protein